MPGDGPPNSPLPPTPPAGTPAVGGSGREASPPAARPDDAKKLLGEAASEKLAPEEQAELRRLLALSMAGGSTARGGRKEPSWAVVAVLLLLFIAFLAGLAAYVHYEMEGLSKRRLHPLRPVPKSRWRPTWRPPVIRRRPPGPAATPTERPRASDSPSGRAAPEAPPESLWPWSE